MSEKYIRVILDQNDGRWVFLHQIVGARENSGAGCSVLLTTGRSEDCVLSPELFGKCLERYSAMGRAVPLPIEPDWVLGATHWASLADATTILYRLSPEDGCFYIWQETLQSWNPVAAADHTLYPFKRK